jgi:hypothetical protein
MMPPNMRCVAVVAKTGLRCQMRVPQPGARLCRYHDPELAPATHALNRQLLQRYHARKKAEKEAAKASA